MVHAYKKGVPVALSEHFTSKEFDCHCSRQDCEITLIDDELIRLLEKFRIPVGPIGINSGFRCDAHNAEVGGEEHSFHPEGKAADVRSLNGLTGSELAMIAESDEEIRENGIGTYSDRIHLDSRGYPARWQG